jgi:hypothetical protein
MARFPCDQHGLRYTGPQRTAYLAILKGTTTQRNRRRLCKDCFAALEAYCEASMVSAASEGEPQECMECASTDLPTAAFATLYPGGDDRIDFYGRICGEHLGVVEWAFWPVQGGLRLE